MVRSTFRLRLNSPGVVQLLQDPGVQADLRRRAEAVAGAMPAGEWDVSDFTGRDRAQAVVRTGDAEARTAASEDPASVVSALDSGRL